MKKIILIQLILIGSSAAMAQNQYDFTEVAALYGIEYSYDSPYEFGLGISFYDFNKDGLDDITFGGAAGEPIHFFRNANGSFVSNGLTFSYVPSGVPISTLWVDSDNDGDLDLSICNFNGFSMLGQRDSADTLTDISASAGFTANSLHGVAGAWADYDVDGMLDFYAGNRDYTSPGSSYNRLWKNNGTNTFSDVTFDSQTSDAQGWGLGVVFTDYNKDGLPDIHIANDRITTDNKLLENNEDGIFLDVSDPSSTGMSINGMGIAPGDFNNDGHEDYYVTNTGVNPVTGIGGNVFSFNNGDGTFTEVASDLGLLVDKVGWGASFADFDNDGDLDLFVANHGGQPANSLPDTNSLFWNAGNGTFIKDQSTAISGVLDIAFGCAVGDMNNDGYPDIAVMCAAPDSVKIWKNNGGTNRWVKFNLEGVISNAMGIGSWVEVYANSQTQYRYTRCGTSYGSQDGRSVMVGLGQAETIDSVVVRWPSGIVDTHLNLPANQTYDLVESSIITNARNKVSFKVVGIPNPTSGIFVLAGIEQGGLVHVRGVMGNVIKKQLINSDGNNRFTIDISDLPSGVYLVSGEAESSGTWVARVLKK
jgi:hypothetical protein